MNRLTNANSTVVPSESYSYNSDGRFLTKNRTGNSIYYNYTNADNKIESVTVNGSNYSFAYDAKGNVTNDGLNNALLSNYSFRNLPTTMNNFSYTYNDNGERIKKLETDSAKTNYYLRDYLGRELVIYNYETNDPKEVNIFANGLVGKIELTDSTIDRYYYLKDHLGSVRVVLDNNGNVVTAQDYYPYGETLRQFNNTRYMLTEKERDAESSNDYFGARYYNNKLGVWLQVDPLSEKYPRWSPYNYTLCNPMNLIDTKGMEAEDDKEQKKKDELFEWLSSGHEGFPSKSYRSMDRAAVEAIFGILEKSIKEDREYVGWIYLNDDETYSFTEPLEGEQHEIPKQIEKILLRTKPKNAVAVFHTHGALSKGYADEKFSEFDVAWAQTYLINGFSYLGTPSGKIFRFDVRKNEINELRFNNKLRVKEKGELPWKRK